MGFEISLYCSIYATLDLPRPRVASNSDLQSDDVNVALSSGDGPRIIEALSGVSRRVSAQQSEM